MRRGLVAAAVVLALGSAGLAAAMSGPLAGARTYLVESQQADGGFAEAGSPSDPALSAWAALGLVASGGGSDARSRALDYLRAHEDAAASETDVALQTLARAALGDHPDTLLARVRGDVRSGPLVNAAIWAILALRGAREPVPPALVRSVLAAQSRSGGWSWHAGGNPDSNDTAAALEALRAADVTGSSVVRGLAALRTFRNADGGYALTAGRESDAQSTAWAIQGLAAWRRRPGAATWRYLSRLRRSDGSYRYSTRYATTPVWVTAQVAVALSGRPFPLLP
jgi:iron complex transport system substrate-binding protein